MSKIDDLVLIFNSKNISKEEKEKRIPDVAYELCGHKRPYDSAISVIDFLVRIHDDEVKKMIIEEIRKRSEREKLSRGGKVSEM